ncbi:MAG: DUF2007 domain-containing protein [Candidatus Marinimicrobia bacterium]|nr:DUF2007 domain-containing protein [Candidatus Neomarinimicrobiota bacterium]
MTDESVVLRTYLTRTEAELDQALLESCGIRAFLHADDAGGMQPNLLFGNGVRLIVSASQAEEASQILTGDSDQA